jgi:TetR/AcrR family transcriptional repressor of nem operon
MKAIGNTKARALVEGQKLLQTFGYNGFSFQHLADAVGVKKPSLYDHFKSKEDFGRQLISEYETLFINWAETVSVFEPEAQVGAFFEIFVKFTNDKKLCPICAMSADVSSFPKEMKHGLEDLYVTRKTWLKNIIKLGQSKKQFRKDKTSEELANLVNAIGLGAHLGARVTGKIELVKEAKKQALELLKV